MNGWIVFWKMVLLIAIFLYFGMGIIVAIGGIGDIKKFFRDLQRSSDNEDQ